MILVLGLISLMACCRVACTVGCATCPAGIAGGGAVETTSGVDGGTACSGTVVAAIEVVGGSVLCEGS